MSFSLFGTAKIWSVGDLTRHIRQTLESDYRLQDVWVAGEVSNVSRPSSGHLYFTLKDADSALRCVMWRAQVEAQVRLPVDGEAMEVQGRISVYEAGGQYQLYADVLRPAGEGVRHLDFIRLKEKLAAEGLFDPDRKQALPDRPRVIGIVTSPTGAALHDVAQVLQRRYPLASLLLAPSPVQGSDAPQGIIRALSHQQLYGAAEVILLVRGGGSVEDLAAFNDEAVVRAVAACRLPIISGVGHATDLVLTDYSADLAAPTPSAAAELAAPDRTDLIEEVDELWAQTIQVISGQLGDIRQDLIRLQARLANLSPTARILSDRQRIDDLLRRARIALNYRLSLTRSATENISLALRAFSPDAVLQRGFALVTRSDNGRLVASIHDAQPGDRIRIRLHDGSLAAEISAKT